ncbi:MAG: hypothetical protein ACRDNS_28555, partial [Trebonia sp.]
MTENTDLSHPHRHTVTVGGVEYQTSEGGVHRHAYGPAPRPASPYVDRVGSTLTLDGKPWQFTGLNYYSALRDGNLPGSLTAMGRGVKALRFWCFQSYLVSGGAPNWAPLDALLAACRAAGVRVIPTLANQWSYGDGVAKDLAWFQDGYKSAIQSGEVVPYREFAGEVTARYADDPTIALWQLINEGQAVNDDGTCNESTALAAMQAFAADMGRMIKAGDPNHLLSLGNVAGFSGTGLQFCGSA